MKTVMVLPAIAALTLALGACGHSDAGAKGAAEAPAAQTATNAHSHDALPGGTGRAIGNIRTIDAEGRYVSIEHGPFTGIDMAAMTMGFAALSSVDLSGFAPQDRVEFEVKVGRDGSYRITAICTLADNAAHCLQQ